MTPNRAGNTSGKHSHPRKHIRNDKHGYWVYRAYFGNEVDTLVASPGAVYNRTANVHVPREHVRQLMHRRLRGKQPDPCTQPHPSLPSRQYHEYNTACNNTHINCPSHDYTHITSRDVTDASHIHEFVTPVRDGVPSRNACLSGDDGNISPFESGLCSPSLSNTCSHMSYTSTHNNTNVNNSSSPSTYE